MGWQACRDKHQRQKEDSARQAQPPSLHFLSHAHTHALTTSEGSYLMPTMRIRTCVPPWMRVVWSIDIQLLSSLVSNSNSSGINCVVRRRGETNSSVIQRRGSSAAGVGRHMGRVQESQRVCVGSHWVTQPPPCPPLPGPLAALLCRPPFPAAQLSHTALAHSISRHYSHAV